MFYRPVDPAMQFMNQCKAYNILKAALVAELRNAARRQVLATYGHVRELPAKTGSVQPEQEFAMLWEQSAAARPRLRELAAAVKKSDSLVLATDPDREGEAISWHVYEELQVYFNCK